MTTRRHHDRTNRRWAAGFAITAGLIMILAGLFQVLEGLVALVDDSFYLQAASYAFDIDLTTWGWIHLVIGALVAVTGGLVIRGDAWARGAAMALALLAAVANFVFVPYYPLWSILVLALNATAIWALAMYDPQHRAV
jgi:hypothetical protein